MALPELDTLARLSTDLIVVVYDDAAYGAEVHHFRPLGEAVEPRAVPADRLRRARRGRRLPRPDRAGDEELEGVRDWLAAPDRPLVVDAKVDPDTVRGMARGGLPRPLTRGAQ